MSKKSKIEKLPGISTVTVSFKPESQSEEKQTGKYFTFNFEASVSDKVKNLMKELNECPIKIVSIPLSDVPILRKVDWVDDAPFYHNPISIREFVEDLIQSPNP